MKTPIGTIALAIALGAALDGAQVSIPYADAKPILGTLREDLLPGPFRGTSDAGREAAWPGWVAQRDAEIRARVARGDEDSIVNLVLYGATFTTLPRATQREIDERGGPASPTAATLVRQRIEDLIESLAAPGVNERLQLAREVLERHGINPATPQGKDQALRYLVQIMTRVGEESDAYDRAVQSANGLGDPAARMAQLATLFRERGLSSDTSIFPGFAIEESLEALESKGLLRDGTVRRVAIIGPGLDIVDKANGYDFYPEQTIQPFALVDSLRRLGLAGNDLRMTTFDLSARVNRHLEGARRRVRGGGSYVLQLPRDRDQRWTADLVSYWQRLGDRIGTAAAAVPVPATASSVQVRAVRVRPAIVAAITPEDINVVLQRLDPIADSERFDLIVATNVLLYYDIFEQSLALSNIARMLKPGGLFLTNDPLVDLPGSPLSPTGATDVAYTDSSGSRVSWYRK